MNSRNKIKQRKEEQEAAVAKVSHKVEEKQNLRMMIKALRLQPERHQVLLVANKNQLKRKSID